MPLVAQEISAEKNESQLHENINMDQFYLSVVERLSGMDAERIDEFKKNLKDSKHINRILRPLSVAKSLSDEDIAFLIAMMSEGLYDALELLWWRSENPQTRLCILTLFYGGIGDTDVSFFPKFNHYCDQFSLKHRTSRQKELIFVLRYETLIKSKMKMKNWCQSR